MVYDSGAIEARLAAGVGDDPELIAELHTAFVASARRTLATLQDADEDSAWLVAAIRLHGLAASFGARQLMTLAKEMAAADPYDLGMLERLRKFINGL